MVDILYKWYEELIIGQVCECNKVKGVYFDDIMIIGDVSQVVGVIKFLVISGFIEVVKVFGVIQKVKIFQVMMMMVFIQMDEFEVVIYVKLCDLCKQGLKEQVVVFKEVIKVINIKKDFLKLDVLVVFVNVDGFVFELMEDFKIVEIIGDGFVIIDILYFCQVVIKIYGIGVEEGFYWLILEVWMDQLEMYKEWVNVDYQGDKDLFFVKMDIVCKIIWCGVYIFILLDVYFIYGNGGFGIGIGYNSFNDIGYLDIFIWLKEVMGVQMDWFQDIVSVLFCLELEGMFFLLKVGFDGVVIGVLFEQVKWICMKVINVVVCFVSG